jgi:Flp pilus assembly protein TadD
VADLFTYLRLPLTPLAKERKQDSRVLSLLGARDDIAQRMTSEKNVDSTNLAILVDLDQSLLSHASLITKCVNRLAFQNWRQTVQPAEDKWWWRLDEIAGQAKLRLDYVWPLLMWITIAISLSYIVETARRFMSGGVDILSTVLQGLLALLVGGTLVQLAWHVVEGVKHRSQDKSVRRWQWTRIAFAVLLILIAFLIKRNLPQIANHYSAKCTSSLLAGNETSAVQNCERAVSLRPDDSNAHWVLGKAYEAMYDYDKAKNHFKMAIRYNDRSCKAYNDLAYLYIVRDKNYSDAVALTDSALEKCERPDVHNPTFYQDEKSRIEYSLYKNRGWAYLRMESYWLAEQNIRRALEVRDFGAEGYCLLAQILEQQKRVAEAEDNWSKCVDFARTSEDEKGEKDEVEPKLLSTARERSKETGLTEGDK